MATDSGKSAEVIAADALQVAKEYVHAETGLSAVREPHPAYWVTRLTPAQREQTKARSALLSLAGYVTLIRQLGTGSERPN